MLQAIFPKPAEVREQATPWGTWPGDVPAGQVPAVSESTALGLAAVLGCTQLITDSISTLPIDTYRDNGETRTEIAPPRWLKNPTIDLDWIGFCSQVVSSLVLHGNSYSSVTRSGTSIVEIIPLDPCNVRVERKDGRKRFYGPNGQEFRGEILHIPGLMLPGAVTGLNPIEYARQSVALGLQAQTYASDQFLNSLNMDGVISFPGKASPDPATLASAWLRRRRKGGRGLPGVLEGGGTYTPTTITNEAAQFLESRKWGAAEVCAQVFLIDPRELGIPLSGSTLDYTNGETRRSELLTKGLLRWMVRVEKGISSLLPSPQYMKFNVDGFLRGDSAARWNVYEIASRINTAAAAIGQKPVLLTDEMRDFEDLNPIKGDDPVVVVEPVVEQQLSQPVVVENHLHMPEQREQVPSQPASVTNETHVHIPDSVLLREPVVIPAPVVNVPAPVVNVEAPIVNVQPETAKIVRRVERGSDGRIVRLIDEPEDG